MKERIYTIPVTDAFRVDSECPMCILEQKLEDEYIEYYLGPSLMEPDHRIETNDKGFCAKHFELLYNKQENRLGLGLIIDTYLCEQNERLKKLIGNSIKSAGKKTGASIFKKISEKVTVKQPDDETDLLDKIISQLENQEKKCTVCDKLDYTMDRYIDVILYLWFKEEDFRNLFNIKKGFCMKHLKSLLKGTKKYLNSRERAIFIENLLRIQMENMDRIQQEVNWFTKKFDYRYNNEPWGNSRDALPRSIQKIVGPCRLK